MYGCIQLLSSWRLTCRESSEWRQLFGCLAKAFPFKSAKLEKFVQFSFEFCFKSVLFFLRVYLQVQEFTRINSNLTAD